MWPVCPDRGCAINRYEAILRIAKRHTVYSFIYIHTTMRYHNKSVFTLLLLLLPTLVLMGKETSNSRQARKIFDHTYQMVYGRQGSTLSYSVNIIGLYKAAGTIWMQGKKSS